MGNMNVKYYYYYYYYYYIILNNNNKLPTQWHIINDAKILSGNQIQFYLYVS